MTHLNSNEQIIVEEHFPIQIVDSPQLSTILILDSTKKLGFLNWPKKWFPLFEAGDFIGLGLNDAQKFL